MMPEPTKGQNTPLAKYCKENPSSGACRSPSTAEIANLGIAETKKLKQERKAEQAASVIQPENTTQPGFGQTQGTGDTSLGTYVDQELSQFSKAEVLKTDVSSATFTPANGEVKRLINSVSFFSGEVYVIGGGTWTILHSVEDALINRIKEAGPSSFSPEEQSYISAWVNSVMKDSQEHPDYSSKVLPGFIQ